MAKILVSGLITVETTVAVEHFPVEWAPVGYPFFGIGTTVSGVGLNVAKALGTLGHELRFNSIIGRDLLGGLVCTTLAGQGVPTGGLHPLIAETSSSVILYDKAGKRRIYCDLKDLQETAFPDDVATASLADCDLAVLCNINFSRPLLAMAKARQIPVATDVHVLSDLDDAYNQDFLRAADILFLSHDALTIAPREFLGLLASRFNPKIIVMGLGAEGALLRERGDPLIRHVPARTSRPVVNTIGAGDALFSAFLHGWLEGRSAIDALGRATHFASWKIGESSASEGFLDPGGLERLVTGE